MNIGFGTVAAKGDTGLMWGATLKRKRWPHLHSREVGDDRTAAQMAAGERSLLGRLWVKLGSLAATIALLTGFAMGQSRAEPESRGEMFLVEDSQHGRWCGYASKPESISETERMKSMAVADVTYSKGRLSAIQMTQWDESGDWVVGDTYSLDDDGGLLKVARVTYNFSLGITQDRSFRIRNGRAVMETSASRATRTGEATLDLSGDDVPDVAVVVNSRSFPFWRIIRDRLEDVFLTGKVCVAGSDK